ncbi:MAG TPA: hypothetical protein VFB22_03415 [Candidatus Baltobacteraceae bacterium]|nr:hypothetical protein [Candidatus Baltobacteraceae bacterium]
MTATALVALRFAVAIVFDALAFTVWDVGTRPPLRLVRDVAAGARIPRRLFAGAVRFVLGVALLLLAALVARPAMATARTFTVLETLMLAAGLLVEQLVGPDLRRAAAAPSAKG